MKKKDQSYFKSKARRVEIALKSVQSPNQPKNHPKTHGPMDPSNKSNSPLRPRG